jgi:CubicO group peptidase (beta-lactamase class C family)
VLLTTVPAVSRDLDFFPGIKLKWGFGHMITTQSVPEGRSAGSLTWAGIYNTYYWIDPKKRIAAVFMTQVLIRRRACVGRLPAVRARHLCGGKCRLRQSRLSGRQGTSGGWHRGPNQGRWDAVSRRVNTAFRQPLKE